MHGSTAALHASEREASANKPGLMCNQTQQPTCLAKAFHADVQVLLAVLYAVVSISKHDMLRQGLRANGAIRAVLRIVAAGEQQHTPASVPRQGLHQSSRSGSCTLATRQCLAQFSARVQGVAATSSNAVLTSMSTSMQTTQCTTRWNCQCCCHAG